MNDELYVATAYRWGKMDAHRYEVYRGKSKERAISAARKEAQDRCGKYGVEVMLRGEGFAVPIAYFPSRYGERNVV